ncbi:MAG TPA: hypothetical protein PKI34_12450 [Bacteroidales bacterium]|nr:hypothetical protein [Bacteroidales bacterium]
MKKLLFLFLFLPQISSLHGQTLPDTLNIQENGGAAADDPSQFFTRVELFNEFQHYPNGVNLNQTVLRTVLKIGKRFTTRLDVPFVYNSGSPSADYEHFGLGDISFRLLGYRFFQSKKSALTASVEISLNTAQSPLLGTGKNVIMPVISYSSMLKDKKLLLAMVFQQANSFGGDKERETISFSKLQVILLTLWTRKMWTVLAPEWYIDYVHGGVSMNLEARFAFAPVRRINLWAQTGVGVFGDFVARYQWGGEVGCRYFFLKNSILKKNSR